MGDREGQRRALAQNLDHLFAAVRPAKGEYTLQEDATAIRERGHRGPAGEGHASTPILRTMGRARQPLVAGRFEAQARKREGWTMTTDGARGLVLDELAGLCRPPSSAALRGERVLMVRPVG